MLATSDAGARATDDGCAWGACAEDGPRAPRCVATGIADGTWLTADWDRTVEAENCSMVPRELGDPATPGWFARGNGPIGEIQCEGLRPGEATLRVRVRIGVPAGSQPMAEPQCRCGAPWVVSVGVVINGREMRSMEGLRSMNGDEDGSCRRGPDASQEMGVTVGADGRLSARVELAECFRYGRVACLFMRGTGVSVEQ